jgi:hypothetical protein
MFQKIKFAALSAVLGLGTLAAMPATAQADSFYFGITPHGPRAGVIIDEGRSYRHGPDRRWGPDRHWGRDRGCSAREAVHKAQRMGIRRAHVRSENRRTIHVGGRSRGHYVTVVFANAPRCPVIR